ncbi:BAG-associated GRAM protein 1 isoform X1 [Physcomitrium patens]|uniref:BAG-associated GRAM protein 1 isoform X1 n=1 Tax=Physcomitrium patens TaxID=3218 RepID=UPI003CCE4DD8
MQMIGLQKMAMDVFIPSWGEINLSLAAAVVFIFLLSCYQHFLAGDDTSKDIVEEKVLHLPAIPELEDVVLSSTTAQAVVRGVTNDWDGLFVYLIRFELLAARNLISASLNGTSDPYAIIECGTQKRFSSVVPSSRNPAWGEEFDFYAEDLPVQIKVAIFDWDIVWKSTSLGSTTLDITEEGQTEAMWCTLDSASGQVCLQVATKRYPVSQSGNLSGHLGVVARRRLSLDKPVGTEVRQKPGPLQLIFELPPDEVIEHSYSCALERSFLYHGRMYLSAWHICFHSNVFAKQMKIVLPYDDIEEVKKSHHSLINPAITITLRSGSGGQGVPPLVSVDGRSKYKFASFWNRNQAFRALERALKKFTAMQETAKEEQHVSSMRTKSGSFRVPEEIDDQNDIPVQNESPIVIQPFLKDDVLSEVINVDLPCTAEEYFAVCLTDDSQFMQKYCDFRKDSELKIGKWEDTEQYGGFTRKVTYRSICRSPMCPPDTAVTVWQHAAFSNDKKVLVCCTGPLLVIVFEAVSQIHDVPFGTYFEVHAKWIFETKSKSICSLIVKVGAHFQKWCLMQSKIKSGTVLEMKQDAELFIELARKELARAKEDLQEKAPDEADVGSVGAIGSILGEPIATN